MREFNYEKMFFCVALKEWQETAEEIKEKHAKLAYMVRELRQGRDLNIPVSEDMKAVVSSLSCEQIARLSRVSHALGHWCPGHEKAPFAVSSGESWKVSNILDQILRERLGVTRKIEIHEGEMRVTFSSKDCWLWSEFGLATEKNLENFKACGLPFDEKTLDESAKKLAAICGDLWPDQDEVTETDEYRNFINRKKARAIEEQKKEQQDKVKKLEKEIEDLKQELKDTLWFIEHGLDIDNAICYNHLGGEWHFGWRKKLDEKERAEITAKMKEFPGKWKFHREA